MASYAVRLYQNTGFNGVNIPDSPAVLNLCTYIDVDPVQILQDRGLDHIDVKATWSQVENCDYVKVGSWYYSVPSSGAQMLSEATARLTLLSDPLTSAGGFTISTDGSSVTTSFTILDGVTERCTVATDEWGSYTASDPLIAPQQPLVLETEWLNGEAPADDVDNVFVESTADILHILGEGEGTTYTDEATGETVTVPEIIPTTYYTGYYIDSTYVHNAGTRVYNRADEHTEEDITSAYQLSNGIPAGLERINALGVASGTILNQWRVPKNFASYSVRYETLGSGYENQIIDSLTGSDDTFTSTLTPDYTTVNNKRLLYGDYNKYGLITCSGSSAEFKPEDLGGETAPSITCKSDPRPKGKPYYRFTTINGNTDFWRNSLPGSEWESVPLVYQGASGSALTRLNFDNDRKITDLQKSQYEDNYLLSQISAATGIATNAVAMAATGGMMGGMMGVGAEAGQVATGMGSAYSQAGGQAISSGMGILSGISTMVTNAIQKGQYEDMYRAQKANELSQLYQSTQIFAPTVNFPYNADILRDVKHNGVLVYKYHMTVADTQRCDKLLTMYGYYTAQPLDVTNFAHRKYFDYVSCSTVSVTGLPKWWCDEIATQLKVGVRVWHVLPSATYYSSNPIRGAE